METSKVVQNNSLETSEGVQTKVVRSNSWIERLVVCRDCGHVAQDKDRHNQHLTEARHINTLRNMAYRFIY